MTLPATYVWSKIPTASAPPAMDSPLVTYDSHDGYILMFGGDNFQYGSPPEAYNQTWEYASGRWQRLLPEHSPPPMAWGALTDDPNDGYVVLFGEENHSNATNVTWVFQGGDWTELHPSSSPTGRWNASVAYDPQDRAVVLFGGQTSSGFLSDTWEFSANEWERIRPRYSPASRSGASSAWDPAANGLLLHGGVVNRDGWQKPFDETWVYSNHTWKSLSPRTLPCPNSGCPLVTDPRLSGVLMQGGGTSEGTTWLFLNSDWMNVSPRNAPAVRSFTSFTFDAADHYDLLFGGIDDYRVAALNDSWAFNASISANPKVSLGDVGIRINFTAQGSGGLPPYTYSWDLGDGNHSIGPIVRHAYAIAGTYPLTVNCTDGGGSWGSSQMNITVNATPTLNISAFPYHVDVDRTVQFGASPSFGTPPYSIEWEFGDGSRATQASTTHSFAKPGLYHVMAWVNDSAGGEGRGDTVVNAYVGPSAAVSVTHLTGVVGVPLKFTGSVTGGVPPFTYVWAYGDGNWSTSSGLTTFHTYEMTGQYAVQLLLRDAGAGENVSGIVVSVTAPMVVGPIQGVPKFPENGQLLDLSVSPQLGAPPYAIQWTFDDGTSAIGQSTSHAFVSPGAHIVVVQAVDAVGWTSDATVTVEIPAAFAASVSVNPAQVLVGGRVDVRAAVAGGYPPYRLHWTGLPIDCRQLGDMNLSCVSASAQTYFITLTATDSQGFNRTDSRNLSVYSESGAHPAARFPGAAIDLALLLVAGVGALSAFLFWPRIRKGRPVDVDARRTANPTRLHVRSKPVTRSFRRVRP